MFEAIPLLRSAPPDLVEVDICRDLPKPPLKSRLTSKGVYTFEDPKKHILGEILALLGGEALTKEEGTNAGPEFFVELLVALFHAGSRLDPLDEMDGIFFHEIQTQAKNPRIESP